MSHKRSLVGLIDGPPSGGQPRCSCLSAEDRSAPLGRVTAPAPDWLPPGLLGPVTTTTTTSARGADVTGGGVVIVFCAPSKGL